MHGNLKLGKVCRHRKRGPHSVAPFCIDMPHEGPASRPLGPIQSKTGPRQSNKVCRPHQVACSAQAGVERAAAVLQGGKNGWGGHAG